MEPICVLQTVSYTTSISSTRHPGCCSQPLTYVNIAKVFPVRYILEYQVFRVDDIDGTQYDQYLLARYSAPYSVFWGDNIVGTGEYRVRWGRYTGVNER